MYVRVCVWSESEFTHTFSTGYPNFGADIGGYREGKGQLGRTKELLIRWAQLGAFSPLMENGGNKEHRPWMFDNQTLAIYRQYIDYNHRNEVLFASL